MEFKKFIALFLLISSFGLVSCQKGDAPSDDSDGKQLTVFSIRDMVLAQKGVLAVVIKEPDNSFYSSLDYSTYNPPLKDAGNDKMATMLFVPTDDSVELRIAEAVLNGKYMPENPDKGHSLGNIIKITEAVEDGKEVFSPGKVLYQGKGALLCTTIAGAPVSIPDYMVYAVSGSKQSIYYYIHPDSGMNDANRPIEYLLISK